MYFFSVCRVHFLCLMYLSSVSGPLPPHPWRKARHEVALKAATSRAGAAEVSVETLREALVEARERAEALERKAADKAALGQDMELSLEEARGEGRELWARLEQQV